jgi:hypothetical protein
VSSVDTPLWASETSTGRVPNRSSKCARSIACSAATGTLTSAATNP